MFFRTMMLTNGLVASLGTTFWVLGLDLSSRGVSAEDQAIGYVLLTILRGY